MANDMRFFNSKSIHDCQHIPARNFLAIGFRVSRDVGRRIAACRKGYAAMEAREEAQLWLPAPVIAGKFVDEHHHSSGASLLNVEHRAVERGNSRHPPLPANSFVRSHILRLQANRFETRTK